MMFWYKNQFSVTTGDVQNLPHHAIPHHTTLHHTTPTIHSAYISYIQTCSCEINGIHCIRIKTFCFAFDHVIIYFRRTLIFIINSRSFILIKRYTRECYLMYHYTNVYLYNIYIHTYFLNSSLNSSYYRSMWRNCVTYIMRHKIYI